MHSPAPHQALSGKSPSPHKPSPSKLGMSPPHAQGTDQFGFPTTECLCPTCQYYKACYFYHQEAHSPEMAAYQMYPYGFYPMMPMMGASPPNTATTSFPSTRSNSPMMVDTTGLMMPVDEVERAGNPVIDQFQQAIGNLSKLACSANGRSMLQAVMRLQHLDKIQTIFDELIADADTVFLDSHGCHVVRSLIEAIDDHQIVKLMEVLHTKLVLNMCTLSQYTRRILQTLFERHKSTMLQNVVEIMASNAQYLAATQQGCISLMRVFERCTAEQKHMLAQPLLMSFADLACDPFGNYVVQCCLEHSEPSVAVHYTMDCFSGQYLRIACNKFGSNVTEKIIRAGNPQVRRVLLDELIFNPAALQQAACDGFGNFVVQTIVDTCTSPGEIKKITDRLRPVIGQSPYGQKIDAKIKSKRIPFMTHQKSRPHTEKVPMPAAPIPAY